MTLQVTVPMSVYNRPRWIRESIESVWGQTFTDFEFILVNDDCRDSSLDIINDYARETHRHSPAPRLPTGAIRDRSPVLA